ADHILTDTTSLELAASMASDPTLAATRLFLLTAFDDPTDTPGPSTRRLTKPVCQSELLNLIVECFCAATVKDSRPTTDRAPSATTATSRHSGRARILLAEDNRINQMFAQEL